MAEFAKEAMEAQALHVRFQRLMEEGTESSGIGRPVRGKNR